MPSDCYRVYVSRLVLIAEAVFQECGQTDGNICTHTDALPTPVAIQPAWVINV